VEVRDTGIGIPVSEQHRLFNSFTQMDSTITRKYGGSGLGLAICKKLIEAMKGQIGMDSESGKGSVVWFEIDLTAIAADKKHTNKQGADFTYSAAPARILLADDNYNNLLVIKEMLVRAGHAVTTVEDGTRALDTLQQNDFDIALLDIRMPGMDGTEVIARIRALEGDVSSIPAIAITADVLKEHVDYYLNIGFDEVVSKPVDWQYLDSLIAAMVGYREATN